MKRKQKKKKRLIACAMAVLVLFTSFGFTETTWAGQALETNQASVSVQSEEERAGEAAGRQSGEELDGGQERSGIAFEPNINQAEAIGPEQNKKTKGSASEEGPLKKNDTEKNSAEETALEGSLPAEGGTEGNGLEDRFPEESGTEGSGLEESFPEGRDAEDNSLKNRLPEGRGTEGNSLEDGFPDESSAEESSLEERSPEENSAEESSLEDRDPEGRDVEEGSLEEKALKENAAKENASKETISEEKKPDKNSFNEKETEWQAENHTAAKAGESIKAASGENTGREEEPTFEQADEAEQGQNPSLNEAEQAEAQGMELPSLFSFDLLLQASRTTDLIPGSEAEIVKHGYAKYGGRSCGIFTVNGVRAFCLEHLKNTPGGDGVANTGITSPYDDPLIRTILYYTDGGPGLSEGPLAGLDINEVIVRTSFALNKAYANDDNLTGDPDRVDGIVLAQDYLNFCSAHLLQTSDVAFSQTDVTAYIEGDRQRTPDIILNADYRNQVTFTLPADVGIHYNDTGAELSGQAATVTGGQSFYLFKYLQAGGGTYQTGDLAGILNNFQPLVIDTGDESLQKIGILREYPNESRTHLNVTWVQRGGARVVKTSANPEITDGNPCYSLAGAVYGLYDGSGQQIAAAATNEAGIAEFGEVNAGQYTLKELEAPTGYYKDEREYTVTVTAGQTTEIQVQDVPGNDPLAIEITKISQDGTGEEQVAPLSGAEFTVRYYAGYYTKDDLPPEDEATRTWVITTKETVYPDKSIHYLTGLDEAHKVSGPDFYYDGSNPNPILPLGTIAIEETKEPEGYLLEGAYLKMEGSTEKIEGLYVAQIRQEGEIFKLVGGNKFSVYDRSIKGGVKVQKRDAETGGTTPQGGASFAGAQFAIINNNTYEVIVDGKSYAKGQTVKTLTTDKTGAAQTAAELLPYGDYILKETKAPDGYQLSGTVQQSFSITKNGAIVDLTDSSHAIKDEVIRGGVKVQKRDVETGGTTPQGGATLKGAQFQIISDNANPVQVNGKTYQKGQAVATLTTDEKGAAQTAADLLPYGAYILKETKAPDGYQLSGTIQQRFSITKNGAIVDLTDSSHAIKDEVIRGGVKVQKRDAETGGTTPQGGATFAGAQFAIINNNTHEVIADGKSYAKGQTVKTLTTDEKGVAQTAADLLPYGTYILKETKAPDGYQLSGTVQQSFSITKNGAIVDLTDSSHAIKDEVIRGGVKVQKRDLDTEESTPQGDATLKGAEFTITNQSAHPVLVEKKLYQPGEAVKVLTTNEKGVAQTAADLLPYGSYEIEETKAPEGYRLEGTLKRSFSITKDGQLIELTAAEDSILDAVIRGGVTIRKRDLESGDSTPQGGASLAGAVFTITNRSGQDVTVEGKRYKNGEVVKTITTNEQGAAKTEADLLPYGTYELEEKEAPEGYLPEGVLKRTFTIRKNGLLEDLTDKDHAILNQVKRGDFELTKIDSDTQNAMADVQFRITSDTTGESHTFTTDANGFYSSASAWNKHSHNTNVGGAEDGLWFGLTAEGESVPVDDEKGALPYDTYTLEELPSEANEGMHMYRGKLSIYRDSVTVDMGNIENKGVNIGTSAQEENSGSQYARAEEAVTIVDTVSCDGLTKGETYTIRGTLMNKRTGEPLIDAKGEPITAEKELKVKVATGSVKVDFTFDARGLEGETIVVFEQIWQGKEQIAAHEDLNDEAQAIHFPGITTSAADQKTGTHTAKAEEAVVLIDTVHYENLEPGKKYTLQAVLMDRETGEAFTADGEPAQAEATFIPEETSGEAEVEITFDGREAAGKTAVVFETLKKGDTILGVHEDLADEAQTIRFPGITTSARDGESGTGSSLAGPDTVIRDTVSYQKLQPGQEYILKGTLMDKETGEPIKIGGKEVTAERSFVPENEDGETEVVFRFDGSTLAGKAVVVYESLRANGQEVAAHTDLEDEAQTIRFPGIGTTAKDKETGEHTGFPSEKTTITDTVTYQGLIPGKEYTVKGVLMDKESGEPLKEDGKEITAEKTFTAESAEGSVELAFTFDSSALAGKAVVVFERLYYEDREIAVHTDLKDEGQTVTYQEPEIETTAKDKETGEHIGFPSEKTTITDTVAYTGLIPGKEYTVKGVLMDKETGEPVKVDEKEITAEKTFTAKSAEGSVELTFTFDSSALAGKAVVVFERLYYEGREIAVHTDLKDEGQTVTYQEPEIKTTAKDKETGEHTGFPSEKTTITDTVAYTGLIPGKEYTVKGVLMDKETGEPLKEDGEEITAEKTFTAEKAEGSIELAFTFDSSALAGKAVVVFERLYYEDREIAVHTDLKDEGQTVTYQEPEIETTAKNKETGEHTGFPSEKTTITDNVTYTGLIPGKEYTVKGVLMDKENGEPLKEDGKEIAAEKTFTAEKAEGSIELAFTFDSSALAGKAVVVFERLYYEGREIAAHADLKDEGQTVYIQKPDAPEKSELPAAPQSPKTGDNTPIIPWAAVGTAAFLAAACLYRIRKQRKK